MPLTTQDLGRVTDDTGAVTTCVDMVIYGDSGAGKTYRAATAPGPLYVISPDPTGHKSIPFKVPGKLLSHTDDIRETIMGFREGGHGYRTLIVDGLSFIHDMFLKETGQYFYENMGAKDPDLLPIAGRMKIQNRYRDMVRALINLTQLQNPADRVHVIFTTLAERLKEDDTAPFKIRPLIGTNKMNEQFPAFFSVISYIKQSDDTDDKGMPDETRRMLFTNKGGIMARDRLGIFPPAGDAPNLSEYLK